MGKQTRYFRQSKRSMSGDRGARNFGQITRSEGWHMKIINYIKVRGKRPDEEQMK
jgi:hypothetical protein